MQPSEGIYPITIVEIMGWLGEPAVLFAFCLQKLMDRCSDADENTQPIPPHPALLYIS